MGFGSIFSNNNVFLECHKNKIAISESFQLAAAYTALKKPCLAGIYKIGGLIAEKMGRENAQEWYEVSNDYCLKVKKEKFCDLTFAIALFALAQMIYSQTEDVLLTTDVSGRLNFINVACKVNFAMSGLILGNKLFSTAFYKMGSKLASLLGKDTSEWEEMSQEYLMKTKNEMVQDGILGSGHLLSGLALSSGNMIGLHNDLSLGNIFSSSIGEFILYRKLVVSAAYKIGGFTAGLLGKEKATEWNQVSRDYWALVKKDFKKDVGTFLKFSYAGACLGISGLLVKSSNDISRRSKYSMLSNINNLNLLLSFLSKYIPLAPPVMAPIIAVGALLPPPAA